MQPRRRGELFSLRLLFQVGQIGVDFLLRSDVHGVIVVTLSLMSLSVAALVKYQDRSRDPLVSSLWAPR